MAGMKTEIRLTPDTSELEAALERIRVELEEIETICNRLGIRLNVDLGDAL